LSDNSLNGDRHSAPALLVSILLGVIGYSAYLGLPVILGALADVLHLGPTQVGWIGSCELIGLTTGSILASRLLNKVTLSTLVIAASLVAIVANVLTGFVTSLPLVYALRVSAGFAGGACYSWSLATLAWRGDPARNSGIFGIGLVLMGSGELLLLPRLQTHFAALGVFGLLGGLYLIPLLFIRYLPSPRQTAIDPQTGARATSTAVHVTGGLYLAAIALYNIGATSFWAYVERLGDASGLSTGFVANVLNVANIATLLCCFVAWRVARRFGQDGPQILCLVLAAILVATWPFPSKPSAFASLTFLYFQLLTFSQIFQLSLLGTIDRSGRLASLLPAAQGVGQCVGPLAGAAVLSVGLGYREQLIMEACFLGVTAAIYAGVYLRSKAAVPISTTKVPTGL